LDAAITRRRWESRRCATLTTGVCSTVKSLIEKVLSEWIFGSRRKMGHLQEITCSGLPSALRLKRGRLNVANQPLHRMAAQHRPLSIRDSWRAAIGELDVELNRFAEVLPRSQAFLSL